MPLYLSGVAKEGLLSLTIFFPGVQADKNLLPANNEQEANVILRKLRRLFISAKSFYYKIQTNR